WQWSCDACDVDDRLVPSPLSALAPLRGTQTRRDASRRRQYGGRLPITALAATAQRIPSAGGGAHGPETAESVWRHAPASLTTVRPRAGGWLPTGLWSA